jgi:hypothetical protein
MNSDGEITKTKVVDHDETYNAVVDSLSINLKSFTVPKFYLKILSFEIQIFWTIQMNSHREMTKTKVVDRDEAYNFVVDNLSIWNIYSAKILFGNLIF